MAKGRTNYTIKEGPLKGHVVIQNIYPEVKFITETRDHKVFSQQVKYLWLFKSKPQLIMNSNSVANWNLATKAQWNAQLFTWLHNKYDMICMKITNYFPPQLLLIHFSVLVNETTFFAPQWA